jgi:hypothetical protein
LSYSPVLAPLVALVAWTLAMFAWMYATRIPAMRRAGVIDNRIGKRPGHLDEILPAETQWKAHNYNHLLEQPTLFYTVVLLLAIMGDRDQTTLAFAWAYVGLRILHSLVQSTVNVVRYRTALFSLSSACLFLLTTRLAAILVRTSV